MSGTDIITLVTDLTGMRAATLRGRQRGREIVEVRFVLAWLLRRLTRLSYPGIARLLGGRHHTSIMHAVHRVDYQLRQGEGNCMECLVEMIGEIAEVGELEEDI